MWNIPRNYTDKIKPHQTEGDVSIFTRFSLSSPSFVESPKHESLGVVILNLIILTSCSFINSLTLLSMSWYLAVALVICWMIVVTCPNMVAYSKAEEKGKLFDRIYLSVHSNWSENRSKQRIPANLNPLFTSRFNLLSSVRHFFPLQIILSYFWYLVGFVFGRWDWCETRHCHRLSLELFV